MFFLGTFLLMIMAVLDTFFLLHEQHKSLRFNKPLGSFQQGKATHSIWNEGLVRSTVGSFQGRWVCSGHTPAPQ